MEDQVKDNSVSRLITLSMMIGSFLGFYGGGILVGHYLWK